MKMIKLSSLTRVVGSEGDLKEILFWINGNDTNVPEYNTVYEISDYQREECCGLLEAEIVEGIYLESSIYGVGETARMDFDYFLQKLSGVIAFEEELLIELLSEHYDYCGEEDLWDFAYEIDCLEVDYVNKYLTKTTLFEGRK